MASAAGAWAATPVRTSGQDALLLANDLVAKGAYDEAAAILRTLAEAGEEGPVSRRALAKVTAKLAYGQGRSEEAIALLEALVDAKPDDWRTRYDLAHVLMAERRDRDAERHLRAILRLRPGLPAEVGQRARSDLAHLDARRVVRVNFSAAAAPSTNVNSATSDESFQIFGILPARLDDDARAQSGIGVNYAVSGSVTPPIADGVRGHFTMLGQTSDYQGANFDQAIAAVEAGLRFGAAVPGRPSLLFALTGERRYFGGDAFSAGAGIKIAASARAHWGVRLSAALSASNITYDDQPQRDGPFVSASLGATLPLSSRFAVTSGLRLAREVTEEATLRNTQGTLSLGVIAGLPAGASIGVQPAVTYRRFDEASVFYGALREDLTLDVTTRLGLSSLDLGGFTPSFVYRYTDNDSTVSLFDYVRHTADIGLSRQF